MKEFQCNFQILFIPDYEHVQQQELPSYRQFHEHFFMRFFCTNVLFGNFSSYILALVKNLYEKPGVNFINVFSNFSYERCFGSFFLVTHTYKNDVRTKKARVKH